MITVTIPALNEEDHIRETIQGIHKVLSDCSQNNFSIFVFNDRSTDETGAVAMDCAKELNNVTVVSNSNRKGLGWCFKETLRRTDVGHMVLIPGDNAYKAESLVNVFSKVKDDSAVFGYRINQFQARPMDKAIVSSLYNLFIKIILGLKIKDVHGVTILPVKKLKKIQFHAIENMFQIEAIYKVLNKGCLFIEEPVELNVEFGKQKKRGISLKAFRNIIKTLMILKLNK